MPLLTGKQPATQDDRDLDFAAYVDTDLIDLNSPPPEKKPGHGILMPKPRLMLGNGPDASVGPGFDGAGDCVFALITNFLRMAWAVAGKGLFPATGKTAIGNYSEVTGYILNDPSTDNGTNMRTAMNWWRKTGYKDATGTRHKIGGYASIKIGTFNHLLWALYLVDEGVPLGIQFPSTAMQQFAEGKPWTVVPGASIEGGHAILLDNTLEVESWARDQQTVEAFLKKYVDEAYFPVDEEGLVNGKTLEGFDSQQLLADAKTFA
jgi:hypothetical protein